MEGPSIQPPTLTEQNAAKQTIAPYTIHTPLIPLNYTRPDLPNLQIYLKLETFQPGVGSFKIRGASNAIQSRIQDAFSLERKEGEKKEEEEEGERIKNVTVVTASAGNMGQGVAYICSTLKCKCIVIVPDNAPEAKLNAIQKLYARTKIIKVSYGDWWNVIETSDCSAIIGGDVKNHVFIHPVCDDRVVAGNATVGMEILEDCEDVDAIFVPYGGGGLSCGVGSAVQNHVYQEEGEESETSEKKKCKVVSCEPEVAAPMALSKARGEMSSFAEYYQPSFCDGCGGKAVLPPMWELANEVIDTSLAVPMDVVEGGVWMLHEANGVVAEGAGGVSVAAAMFGPIEQLGEGARDWKKVVCVVSGRGINRSKLVEILDKYKSAEEITNVCQHANWTVKGSASYFASVGNIPATPVTSTSGSANTSNKLTVLTEEEVRKELPMHKCIDSTKKALIALSTKTGTMPLRQVSHLPQNEIQKPGYLVTMPSYHNGFAACKLITFYPQNSTTSKYSSHQGVVALFNAKHHGQLLLLADAHEITSIRTAAASAVATIALARKDSTTLAILGTGEQARSHFVSMMETGLPFVKVHIWGRNKGNAEILKQDLMDLATNYTWKSRANVSKTVTFQVYSAVQQCVESADVICTLVPSTDPVLYGEWVKPGTHINAVGACLPTTREMDGPCVAKCKLYCDSKDACFVEAGDVVLALKEGSIGGKDHLVGEIGSVLIGDVEGRMDEKEITLFKSLGVALEDLEAAREIYEST